MIVRRVGRVGGDDGKVRDDGESSGNDKLELDFVFINFLLFHFLLFNFDFLGLFLLFLFYFLLDERSIAERIISKGERADGTVVSRSVPGRVIT